MQWMEGNGQLCSTVFEESSMKFMGREHGQ